MVAVAPSTISPDDLAMAMKIAPGEKILAVIRIDPTMARDLLMQELACCPIFLPFIVCHRSSTFQCIPPAIKRDLELRSRAYETTLYIITDVHLYRHVPEPYELSLTCGVSS